MLIKLLVNVFERARSKLIETRSHNRCLSDSDIEITNFDVKSTAIIVQQQPRSSLSKWLCTTPTKPISPVKSNKVRRSNSWRSLKERENHSITSRTYSVDQLNRNNRKQTKNISQIANKTSIDFQRTRYDRLSSTLINSSHSKTRKQMFSTLSHHSTGADSGYSEDSLIPKRNQHSCPHCHCEQRSSFSTYRKTSTNSSPLVNLKSKNENIISIRTNSQQQQQRKLTRTLADRRRRNLSCDSSLWTKPQHKKIIRTFSPVISERFQSNFTTINTTHCHRSNTNIFGELNLAAIELDSLRTSFSSSSNSSSSSSSSITNFKQSYLVWNDYQNCQYSSNINGTKTFAVQRGDQVHLIKRIGKSTLLVQKQDDGTIGFLPQTCLAHHQINSFLTLKGLRETVL